MRNQLEGLLRNVLLLIMAVLIIGNFAYAQSDPLSSWNNTAPKKAILEFVEKVTETESPDFVPLAERIATFDNDGTLWAEQPIYFDMLEWTTSGAGLRFGLLVHHTDGKREWAYDRDSHVGRLDRGLDEGSRRGWTILDMKDDWKVVFPFEKK